MSGISIGGDFDACVGLETIRFIGMPRGWILAKLSKLPALREVVVVVVEDGSSGTPDEIATIVAAALPNVSVRVIPAGDHEPDVSGLFRKHRQTIRKRVLDRVNQQLAEEPEQM